MNEITTDVVITVITIVVALIVIWGALQRHVP